MPTTLVLEGAHCPWQLCLGWNAEVAKVRGVLKTLSLLTTERMSTHVASFQSSSDVVQVDIQLLDVQGGVPPVPHNGLQACRHQL